MAQREPAKPRKQSASSRHTKKAIAAGTKNLEAGRKRREELAKKAQAEGRMDKGERWARLISGVDGVDTMDDEELAKMDLRNKNGVFGGKKKSYIPSHLAQAMHRESIRRAQEKFRTAAPEAVEALLEIGKNPDVKESDRVRALIFVIERALGKTPDVIRVEGTSEFDKMSAEAVGIVRDLIPNDIGDLDG